LVNNVMTSEMEIQHSPTNSSPITASTRHKSYYPDQNSGQVSN
jgi:hypothetical protein